MRITTKSRYAIRAIYALLMLNGENEPVSLKKISEYEDISLKYLEQIFSRLKRANIVTAARGISGGYMLSKNSEQISVKEIIYAMDGPIKPVDCIDNDGCNKASQCAVNWLWFELKKNVDNFFQNITLSDLKKKNKC
jgi:Rrf2 family protein